MRLEKGQKASAEPICASKVEHVMEARVSYALNHDHSQYFQVPDQEDKGRPTYPMSKYF